MTSKCLFLGISFFLYYDKPQAQTNVSCFIEMYAIIISMADEMSAKAFKALSDPTRFRIVTFLSRMCCGRAVVNEEGGVYEGPTVERWNKSAVSNVFGPRG